MKRQDLLWKVGSAVTEKKNLMLDASRQKLCSKLSANFYSKLFLLFLYCLYISKLLTTLSTAVWPVDILWTPAERDISKIYPGAEFFDEIQTKVLRNSSLLFTVTPTALPWDLYFSNSCNLSQFLQFSYCTLPRRKEENLIENCTLFTLD